MQLEFSKPQFQLSFWINFESKSNLSPLNCPSFFFPDSSFSFIVFNNNDITKTVKIRFSYIFKPLHSQRLFICRKCNSVSCLFFKGLLIHLMKIFASQFHTNWSNVHKLLSSYFHIKTVDYNFI